MWLRYCMFLFLCVCFFVFVFCFLLFFFRSIVFEFFFLIQNNLSWLNIPLHNSNVGLGIEWFLILDLRNNNKKISFIDLRQILFLYVKIFESLLLLKKKSFNVNSLIFEYITNVVFLNDNNNYYCCYYLCIYNVYIYRYELFFFFIYIYWRQWT